MRPLARATLAATAITALLLPLHAQSSAGGPPGNPPLPADMQESLLYDPFLGMNAFVIRYPKGWHLQAVVDQGSGCHPVPMRVFRVTSPDGLMVIETMPPLVWSWADAPDFLKPKQGCLPLDDGLEAQEFLKLLSAELKVEYVGEEPIPQEMMDTFKRNYEKSDQFWIQKYERSGARPPDYDHQLAAANVKFTNGSYKMAGRLGVALNCTRSWPPGYPHHDYWVAKCDATVLYEYAPADRFKEVDAWSQKTFANALPEWLTAWQNALDRRTQAIMNAINQTAAANMAAMNNAFQQQQAAQQRQHEQFMATMQHGTDVSMANAARISATNHTMASDWVDYALGQQTVRDPTTGGTAKVPSGYNYTWRNAAGDQAFQTADPNANPNGSLPGTWTQQTTVHGDGTTP